MKRLEALRFCARSAGGLDSFIRLYYDVAAPRLRLPRPPRRESRRFSLTLLGAATVLELRPGTTDIPCLFEIFHQEIYRLPEWSNPKVIVDVGANIGLTSLYFAIKHPSARIVAVEPMSANFALMVRNLNANVPGRVQCFNCGVSDSCKTETLSLPEPGAFWAFGRRTSLGGAGVSSQDVRMRPLPDLLAEAGVSEVDVLKLDCEGAEHEIARGSPGLIQSADIILGEIHGAAKETTGLLHAMSLSHTVDFQKPFGSPAVLFRASKTPWTQTGGQSAPAAPAGR